MKLLIATQNPGKLQEIKEIIGDLPLTLQSLADLGIKEDVAETGNTYAENALIKAEFATKTTGLPALGDDSGLEVEALGGQPGLYSNRYAPSVKERWDKLLGELKDVPWEQRTARFVCVMAITAPNREPVIVEGECKGIIGFEPKGTNGFGYDPLFYLPIYERTMAELTEEVKNRISHRGVAAMKAKAALLEAWKELNRDNTK